MPGRTVQIGGVTYPETVTTDASSLLHRVTCGFKFHGPCHPRYHDKTPLGEGETRDAYEAVGQDHICDILLAEYVGPLKVVPKELVIKPHDGPHICSPGPDQVVAP